MARFVIRGGHPIGGILTPGGNKNAALPMLAASVLTDEPLILENIPRIEDVGSMLAILDDLGVRIDRDGPHLKLCAASLKSCQLDPQRCRQVRSSILFAGPLSARHGSALIHPPGGDVIGRRRLDTHFNGLRALGITVRRAKGYHFKRHHLHGASLWLDEAGVTATENLLMAAVLAPGHSVIYHAACEPHVQDLCRLLLAMGAQIEGIGTNRLDIEGVDRLHGARYRIQDDPVEIYSYVVAAAITGGRLIVPLAPETRPHLTPMERVFDKLGIRCRIRDDGALMTRAGGHRRILPDFGGSIPSIADGIWPSFPSDLMSIAIVAATQCQGTVLFFEKLFESRMYFVDRLIDMGARIVQCDPHRVMVMGPSRLHASHLAGPDIRAGMALVLAALCARGRSVIENAQVIDRGYESVDVKLAKLGADILREP